MGLQLIAILPSWSYNPKGLKRKASIARSAKHQPLRMAAALLQLTALAECGLQNDIMICSSLTTSARRPQHTLTRQGRQLGRTPHQLPRNPRYVTIPRTRELSGSEVSPMVMRV